LPETIRVKTPAVSSVPSTITGFGVSANFETVMFYFDPVNDIDLDSYAYQLYDNVQGIDDPSNGKNLIASGKNKANVFTISVTNSTDSTPKTYYGKVAVVNSAGIVGTYTSLVSSGTTPLIGEQYISSLTAAKITAGTISGQAITLSGINSLIQSSIYAADNTKGWFIRGDGALSFGGPNGINYNPISGVSIGSSVTITAATGANSLSFAGLVISAGADGIAVGSSSLNYWLTSGKFRTGTASKYILFDPAANSGAGSFTISSDVTIGGTVASTVVGNAATGASDPATRINNANTTITGNKIRTGSIDSNNLSWNGSSTYTGAGTRLDLDGGQIISKNFRIDGSGNASFNGAITAASGTIAGFAIGENQIYKSVGDNSTRLSSADSSLWLYGVYDDQYAESHIYPAEVSVYGVNAGGGTRITGYRINMTDTSGNRNGYISTGSVTATHVTTGTITGHAIDTSGGIAFPASITDGTIIPLPGQGPWRTNLQWTNGGSGRLYYQIDDNSTVKGYLTKTHLSDRRLKSNITQEVEDWLTKFNQIKIYEFEYNNLVPQAGGYECIPEQIKKIGVIADEIEQLFPEFVLGTATEEALIQSLEGKTQEEKEQLIEELDTPQTTVKIDGIYSKPEYQQVDYSSFVPLLMAVNLNQNKRIQELSAKVDELESRLV